MLEILNTLKQAFRCAARNISQWPEPNSHSLRSATYDNDFGMFLYKCINITPEEASVTLQHVAECDRMGMARYLIEQKGATVYPYALWEAVCKNHTGMARYLKGKSPEVEFYYSIFYGEISSAIKYPVKADASLENPALWAARGGNVEFLKNNGGFISSPEVMQEVFMKACEGGHVPTIKLLVEHHKAEVNPEGAYMTPLAVAVYNGNFKAVKFLCEECNADVMAGSLNAIDATEYLRHKNIDKTEIRQYLEQKRQQQQKPAAGGPQISPT